MAKFDWIPYLEGKYLTYYQWFGVIGSTVLIVLSFLSFMTYLILCKIKIHKDQHKINLLSNKSFLEKLKTIFFNAGFCFISGIPLICSALDIVYMVIGILLMTTILGAMVIIDNGRKRWEKTFDYST